jgi:hypothetical protein
VGGWRKAAVACGNFIDAAPTKPRDIPYEFWSGRASGVTVASWTMSFWIADRAAGLFFVGVLQRWCPGPDTGLRCGQSKAPCLHVARMKTLKLETH